MLFEQGRRDWNPYIHIPVTYFKTPRVRCCRATSIEPLKAGRQAEFPEMVQARVLGGGSSVNGMVYMRGNPQDYDNWAAHGCDGWSYQDVLPYFRKSEATSASPTRPMAATDRSPCPTSARLCR